MATEIFEHKGYQGIPRIEAEDGVIAGRILGIDAIVTFEGDTVEKARQAFRDSVDDYLKWCEDRGKAPERPFSGRVTVTISPELHQALAFAAEESGLAPDVLVATAIRYVFVPRWLEPTSGKPIGHLTGGAWIPGSTRDQARRTSAEGIYGHSVEEEPVSRRKTRPKTG